MLTEDNQVSIGKGEASFAVNQSLSRNARQVSLEEAAELARVHYGISATASRLTSERDQNFKLDGSDGHAYALRVSHPSEDAAVTAFQMAALRHIEQVNPDLPVPRVFRTLDGQDHLCLPFAEDGVRAVRLLSYLPGLPLNIVERTPQQRQALGIVSANLGKALRGFFHPAAGHELAWDIKHADRLRPLLLHIPRRDRRDLATHYLDRFVSFAKPRLPSLRAQVVHNDLNAFNVLIDAKDTNCISGILDFGDMVHTPLVNDVAVGASYQLASTAPWKSAVEFISAYHSTNPLTGEELSLLYDLIATRFVVTVTITGWRAMQYPENSAYILKNNAGAWAGLEFLIGYPRHIATDELMHACGVSSSCVTPC